jgi:hypothetical protein
MQPEAPLLLMDFMQVQQERAEHYSAFHAAFKAYLASRAEAAYQVQVQATTKAFNTCSLRVREITERLEQADRGEMAALLREVQQHEREKLRLSLAIQSLQQAHAFKTFSWQNEEEEEGDPLEPPQPRTCGCSAGAHAPGQHHEHAHGPAAAPEPTEREFTLALREAQLALDEHVRSINERIEEVRYALAEEA